MKAEHVWRLDGAHLRTRRAEARQLELGHDERATFAHEGAKLLAEIGRVISFIGRKQFAWEVGTKESTLAHMIADSRGRNYFRAEWLPSLVARAPDRELASALVAPGGLVVIPEPTVTAEDERDAALDVAAELLAGEARTLHREMTRHRALEYARRRRGGAR